MIKRQTVAWLAAAMTVAVAAPAVAGPVGMGLHRTEEHSRAVAKARGQAVAAKADQRVCVAANTPPHRPSQPARTCFSR
jgi:hypothetical protein